MQIIKVFIKKISNVAYSPWPVVYIFSDGSFGYRKCDTFQQAKVEMKAIKAWAPNIIDLRWSDWHATISRMPFGRESINYDLQLRYDEIKRALENVYKTSNSNS